jgi:hypothetical protein
MLLSSILTLVWLNGLSVIRIRFRTGLARAGARFVAHGGRIPFGLSAPDTLMYKLPRAADLGVYAAKHKGRNCAAVAALFLMGKNDNTSLRSAGNNC